MDHTTHMQHALRLAARGLGRVWPNPAVGCVIVRDNVVVGRGHTADGGRPHAETFALQQAGEQAAGADMYVTLEPCSHHGQTPPCVDAIIAANIARVFVACVDPDARVNGQGIAALQAAGIVVEVGLCADDALILNRGFFLRQQQQRPLITIKTAMTLDGCIATMAGASQWITGETTRDYGHVLRAQHDAIMIGIGTALADNPLLNCRLAGLDAYSPVRVVMDTHLRLPLKSHLVQTARAIPLWVITRDDCDRDAAQALQDEGAEIITVLVNDAGRLDIELALQQIAARGITRLLVEGGSQLSASLMGGKWVDDIAVFQAPMIIGGDGLPAIDGFGVEQLASSAHFDRVEERAMGNDRYALYRMKKAA